MPLASRVMGDSDRDNVGDDTRMSAQECERCEEPPATDRGGMNVAWHEGWIDFQTHRNYEDGQKLQVWRCKLCTSGTGMSAFRAVRYDKNGKSKVYDTVKQHFIHSHDVGRVHGESHAAICFPVGTLKHRAQQAAKRAGQVEKQPQILRVQDSPSTASPREAAIDALLAAGVTASMEDMEWVRSALIERGAAVAEVVGEAMGEEAEGETARDDIGTEPRTRATNDAPRDGKQRALNRELIALLQ